MKFINYLSSIEGVSIYPMISLFIFFVFFVCLAIYVVKSEKADIDKASRMPLDDDSKY